MGIMIPFQAVPVGRQDHVENWHTLQTRYTTAIASCKHCSGNPVPADIDA